ncbi:hypothetical protein QYE77_07095 [Thermanaerothrix sp. 4228-RoL]|uniref:DNA recombination and repair protein Rad51-like C-terminal domain-containing protein n=1 Tax=Thermanaerothrix solaris TaxID=3058434 RepID=A0ABU3NMI2_9CHLR|nr:hypothetical protein [Thermanaerothrix sp. 4228-RoL]MDT8898032.1 hypothetical protein [Thermanaerothrix sp. 4228-RoL]
MNLTSYLSAQGLVVLCGPRAVTPAAHHLLVALILRGAVHLLDAGNRLQPYTLTRLLRQHTPHIEALLTRLHLQRAFTAQQVLAVLESLPATAIPVVVLDFLAPFYDETLPLPQAKALLQRSLVHLERLQQAAPLIVTLTPPSQPARQSLFAWLSQSRECMETSKAKAWSRCPSNQRRAQAALSTPARLINARTTLWMVARIRPAAPFVIRVASSRKVTSHR